MQRSINEKMVIGDFNLPNRDLLFRLCSDGSVGQQGGESEACRKSQQKTHMLQEKLRGDIKDFFDYIDGEIVDYDINFRGEVGSWIEDGKWLEQEIQTNLENIITDTGTKYYIVFREYMIYKKDETKEGLCLLTLRDENNHVLFSIFYD